MSSWKRSRNAWAAPWLLAVVACFSAGPAPDAETAAPTAKDPPGARRDTLEELLRDREAKRHPSDGGGRAWLETAEEEPRAVQVSSRGHWTIVYEAGRDGIAEGGSVRLIVSPFWGWSSAQSVSPEGTGYTTAETDAEGIELELSFPSFFQARIKGRKLEPGERIRLVYGAGPAGAVADRYAERRSRFWIGVDGDGDGVHRLIGDSPVVAVAAGPPARLQMVLPSTVPPGSEVALRVAVLDPAGNAGFPFKGSVELSPVPAWSGVPAKVDFEPTDRGVKAIRVKTAGPGVFRVVGTAFDSARENGAVFEAVSNPLLVDAAAPRILWGDLHGHTALSDGTGTVEDYLRYARDVAGLDVIAVTDHDHWGFEPLDENPALWDRIRDEVAGFNAPSRFVTLLGYEWTNWIHGHRHVLYFSGEGALLSSLDPRHDTPTGLWAGLRGKKALTFAHHSAGGPVPTNWEYAPDPELEPVTEIASVHGSSEAGDAPHPIYSPQRGNWVRDVLDRGYRLGFIGSGDSHDGHPGLAHLSAGQGGLAAILSPELTREGVYRALKSRRVYATNGPRIILQAALGGSPIGSELDATGDGESSILFVRAIASAPLRRIDVIRAGRVVESMDAQGVLDFKGTLELGGLAGGEYVYVRAVQADGGAAWSTPFFVN